MAIDVEKIRNIAVIAHGGAGKTSLVESMLFDADATDRIGRVEDGNTVMDYEAEEINRNISISSAVAFCDWNGHRLNIVDTPGYINFIEDTKCCLSAVDGAVVLVSALSGVKAETGKVWKFADQYKVPRIIFVNKMDKENADYLNALESVEKSYGVSVVPLNFPMIMNGSLAGVIDVVKMKARVKKDGKVIEEDIPDVFKEEAEEYRKKLVEKIAETDDDLLEKYLEGTDLSDNEIITGIRDGSLNGILVPAICGSTTGNIGVKQLLDTINE